MKRKLIIISFWLFASATVFGQTATTTAQNNGTIVENTPCPANTVNTFEQYVGATKKTYEDEMKAAQREGFTEPEADFAARLVSKEEFERRKAYAGFECRRIKYMSDGLKVVGFIWKPKETSGKKLPLIIFNRGGSREFSKLSPWFRSGFYHYLANGFVVVASQYRGNDGGEGKEEFGGADVNDVLNLIPLARSLGYADMNNIFMFGWSRGGMMTYLALKKGIPVNAAVVGGGVTDLFDESKKRPGLVANVYKELIPDFDKNTEERLRERSAVYWADKINVPVLMAHGGADWRVSANEALSLAQKLQSLGKTYELVIYAKDNHGVANNRADLERRTVEWFKKYMK